MFEEKIEMEISNSEQLITAEELAKHLSMSVRKIKDYKRAGEIPFIQISRNTIRYNLKRVLDHLKKQEVTPIIEPTRLRRLKMQRIS